ncbi:hypothetical protein GC093_14610 [Paenibacillus sp. LMG 31456]|uniref:YtkA-like domain-containing protein n=1 Tax=Paenibacillus foliorum TaxID=2654974 RepID=A0A972GU01_9BACL|nr:FixH family protein [Paenibacillus foliorum]NOU94439.1 hypothetical protein [Paenibacillus foliorum]
MLDYLKRMSWIIPVLFLLSACSAGTQGEDPAAIQVELVSEPVSAAVMQKITLTAQVTGLVKKEGTTVQFDIRSPEKDARPRYVETKEIGKDSYTAEQSFDKPGTYTIYIHIYREDLHVTKKKQLVVS